MHATILYIQDALCGWCYSFSMVIEQIRSKYESILAFEAISGGMIPPDFARPIADKANYIAEAIKQATELSGVAFGEAYLHHIQHPETCFWKEESLTPATALCLLKAAAPKQSVQMAISIQRLHMWQGKDLSDGDSYHELADNLGLDAEDFKRRLASEEWQEEARYEFALVKQLGITGFPALLLQSAPDKFYLIARGYTPFNVVDATLQRVLLELER
ncbi:MAG: DsbA family protein [Bacteroidetes bacterium]|nr:DsbA family protein [Bacteroidota bacterium]MBS1628548.1 DsbA family protein [Bacteroidota bacterium]